MSPVLEQKFEFIRILWKMNIITWEEMCFFIQMFLSVFSCYFVGLCYYTYCIKKNTPYVISFLILVNHSKFFRASRAETVPYNKGVKIMSSTVLP